MAAVSELITLGIGTPATPPYFLTMGLGIGAQASPTVTPDVIVRMRADVSIIRCQP